MTTTSTHRTGPVDADAPSTGAGISGIAAACHFKARRPGRGGEQGHGDPLWGPAEHIAVHQGALAARPGALRSVVPAR